MSSALTSHRLTCEQHRSTQHTGTIHPRGQRLPRSCSQVHHRQFLDGTFIQFLTLHWSSVLDRQHSEKPSQKSKHHRRRESLTQMVLYSSQTDTFPEFECQDHLNTTGFKYGLKKTIPGSIWDKIHMVSIILDPNVCSKKAIIQPCKWEMRWWKANGDLKWHNLRILPGQPG